MNSRQYVYRFLSVAAVLVLLTSIVGCIGHKDRSALLKGIPTAQVTLRGEHTQAPELQMTVPDGFESEWVEEAQYDKFYIFERSDTGEVQHGMIVFDITPSPRWIIKDTSKYEESKGSLGASDVVWRETRIVTSPTERLFQREMVQHDLLKGTHAPDGSGELAIHAFVVGSDSLLVERLTAAVETLKRLPPHPNL